MAGKGKKLVKRFGYQVLGIVVFLVLVEILAIVLGPYKLPRVEVLAVDFVTYLTHIDLLAIQGGGDAGFLPHLAYTVGRTILGAAIGLPLGVVLGPVSYTHLKRTAQSHPHPAMLRGCTVGLSPF